MYSKLRKVAIQPAASVIIALLIVSTFVFQPLIGPTVRAESASPSSMAAPATTNTYRIVAVGDSLTAGYEHGFTEQSIPYGYVEHVYEQALFHGYRAEYSNYGLLGLRTAGLKRWMDAIVKGSDINGDDIQKALPDPRTERLFAESPLLRSALTKADLILLTIGGNDMYAVLEKLEKGADPADAAVSLSSALSGYETELESALRLMLRLQPKAQIVIADQYLPIPKPIRLGALVFPLYPEADRLFLEASVKQLRERLNLIVQRLTKDGYQVKVANAAAAFVDNELRYTSIEDGDIHPSGAGYAAMGKAFSKAIWGDYREVKAAGQEQPIHIVIDGEELLGTSGSRIVKNYTYLPLRSVAEAMGASVKWNASKRTASIKLANRTVDIAAGSAAIMVNGTARSLEAPPAFIDNFGKSPTLYVPLAALSAGLQFQVIYRGTLKTVFINK
ncbi:lysophospholipase L1-like esterase [Paenibacillus endophyticus]|uniref:Lysophospholipase L1-like esterase n=1 Tax=Paenibacillus endophyticus TaxID=1294268 RepID=A0A7W5G9E9_9BACL|nr:stalk domain-containing protein [Paenibacillus endophyticus]MBB3150897.1 lysophospholipase L1-like esterase [Paenibacillus endophyticus]